MENLRLVELELWSYCNRKCAWCPNAFIDRHSNQYIDYIILKNLIQSLKNIKTLLEEVGLGLENVVKTLLYFPT